MTNETYPITVASVLDAPASQHWPAAAAAGLACLVMALLAQRWLTVDPLGDVPVVGKGSRWARKKQFAQGKAEQLYRDGYNQFKDSIFRITTATKRDTICVPPKYLPELRKLPDDVVSFPKATLELMHSKYTKFRPGNPIFFNAVRTSLTQGLPRLNLTVSDEVTEAMRLELPQSTDWSEFNVTSKILRIVAMVSGRIFIGSELCRDEKYINASINYTVYLMAAVDDIGQVPLFLRPLIAPWLPKTRKLYRFINDAVAIFLPVIKARRKAAKKDDYQAPDDMLQWILSGQRKYGAVSDYNLAIIQLQASFAAIHTTTSATVNAIYWLAAKPELIPMLRDDVQQALLESGGKFTSSALQNMKKLDSFLKEVMRLNPITTGSFTRKVLKPVKLPNGQTIPSDMFIETPTVGIHRDAEIFTDPETFNPLRFYNLREIKTHTEPGTQAAEVTVQAQCVSVSTTNLAFGYGKHACPGRFFAVNEMKMIMSNLLCQYDVRLPDGVTERYKNLAHGRVLAPDPSKTVMVRKV
ncbi:cytochrome P450 [Colletotrichum somersetense]|nr:cytochrome P450 [Colletotrichum somersetense]